jgi:sec-independent protein translocase protein TatC
MRPFPRRLRHGEEATLVEHLGELRTRIFISLAAIVAAFVVTYVFHGRILDWMNRPLPDDVGKPITFSPIEPFSTSILVSLWAALLLALPVILWQMWAFLAPAFQEGRQRSVILLVAFAALLGAGGLLFGYYVVLPAAIHFLTNYDSSHYDIQLRARDYYRFVSFVLVGVAVAFEVPVFVLGLVRLRILSAARLRHTWRYGVFVMVVIGVILPGVDPMTTILTVIPLVALYALSIALAAFFEPRWRARDAAQEAAFQSGDF